MLFWEDILLQFIICITIKIWVILSFLEDTGYHFITPRRIFLMFTLWLVSIASHPNLVAQVFQWLHNYQEIELGSDILCFLFNTTAVRCFPVAHAPSPRASSGGVCLQRLHAQISHEGGPGSWETEHRWSTGSHWLLPGSNNESKYLFLSFSLPWLQCPLHTLALPVTAKGFLHVKSICVALKGFDLVGCSLLSSMTVSMGVVKYLKLSIS